MNLEVVRALIVNGYTDAQIASELRADLSDVVEARREVLNQTLLEIGPNRPITEVFAEHRLRMEGVVLNLEGLANECRDPAVGKYHITLGALKAKAKILDDLLDRGQELGVLPRASRSTKVQVAGVLAVGAMTDPELVGHLGHLNREADRLRGQYDDVSFLDLPEPDVYPDLDPVVVDVEPAAPASRVRRRKA